MATGNQIRGWKDIAAFLATSERTARRWEGERGLPVRRQRGGARDPVFAFQQDLEHWQRSNPTLVEAERAADLDAGMRQGDESAGAEAIPDALPGPPVEKSRRRPLGVRRALVFAAMVICVIWGVSEWLGRPRSHQASDPSPRAAHAGASDQPAPVVLRSVQLEISRPDGWTVTVRIADGGAGQAGGSPSLPSLILRPRVVAAGLMLEIGRADGQPMKDQGGGSQPMVLLLERNVTVQLRQPYRFSVRWLGDEPPRK